MQKKIIGILTILLPGGKAVMGGALSSKFAHYKINSAAFLKEYNEKTKNQIGFTVPAKLTIFEDKTYFFELKTVPTSELLLKALNVEKGGKLGKKELIYTLSLKAISNIAKIKLQDLNTKNLEKAIKSICGTAKNMGINIITTC